MNKNLDEIVEYRGVTDLVVAEVLSDNNKEGEGYKTGEVYELAGVGKISKSTSNSSESKYYNNKAPRTFLSGNVRGAFCVSNNPEG